jgi:hypothetical protein
MTSDEEVVGKTAADTMFGEDKEVFDRGAELLKEVQAGKQFDAYWLPIGEGLLTVRKTVLRILHIEKPDGGNYNHAFGRAIAGTPYAEMGKDERNKLLFCMEHRDDLVEMRVAWTPEERSKVCHPTTMAKRLREFAAAGLDYKPKAKKPKTSPAKDKLAEKDRIIADLEERAAAAEVNVNPEPLFNLAADPPSEITRKILATAGVDRVKDIIRALTEALADSEAFDEAPKGKSKTKTKPRVESLEVDGTVNTEEMTDA